MKIELNNKRVQTLLAILDCSTEDGAGDWFLDEESGKVFTWTAAGKEERSLQEHLNKVLQEENFPDIFG